VPDVDVLFVGPADLCQSMGIPGEWEHPRLWEALERIALVSRQSKVPWAILPLGPDFARRCRDLGCRMFSLGADVWAFQKGVKQFKTEYAGCFD
jgi:2-keto-3-deoxy-L-rhamnonate aldolase RhmA